MKPELQSGLAGVPNSSANAKPMTHAPHRACDSHMHVYDSRYPAHGYVPAAANVPAYRKLQSLLGTQRAVVVQPRVYGNDHTVLLNAIQALGAENTRGIAVVSPHITQLELQELHAGGVRGVRLSLHEPNTAAAGFEGLTALSEKIAALGWHLQLHWTADQIATHAQLLQNLPIPLVFDHMGRLPAEDSQSHPAFCVLAGLLESGRHWIKLSGPYLVSKTGHTQGYANLDLLARTWLQLAPERVVWGSDWPHVTERDQKPDDALLFDVLARWCIDEQTRQQVLVQNPEELYGFEPA